MIFWSINPKSGKDLNYIICGIKVNKTHVNVIFKK